VRSLVLLVLLGALGAGVLWWMRGEARHGASAERPTPAPTAPHVDAGTPVRSAPASESRIPAVDAPAAGLAEERPADAAPPAPPDGIALQGTVRWADDGEPLADLRLVANGAGAVRFAVVSDGSGRFASEPVLGSGRLRLWIAEPREPAPGARPPAGLRLEQEAFLVPGDAPRFEVDLRVRRPALRLDVDVRDRGDAPVAGAEVSLEIVARPDPASPGAGRSASPEHDVWRRATDAAGHVAFALYDVESIQTLGLFAASRDPEGRALASEHLVLEPPGGLGPVLTERLTLDEGARLRVRVLDEARNPIAGMWVWLEVGDEPLFAWLPDGGATGAEGELLLEGLPPRSYVVATGNDSGAVRRRVELARGVESELELVLGQDLAPRLAAAGRVLDESGAPLPRSLVTALVERSTGGPPLRVTRSTDARGRFELHAAVGPRVTVLLDGDLQGDEYAPRSLAVPFGTRDLEFRRITRLPRHELDLELVDAATGERLEYALVLTERAPGTPEYEFVGVVGGLTTLVVSEHPDVRLRVDAVGHRSRALVPARLFDPEGERRLHRIELEPGLRCGLLVVSGSPGDAPGTPLPGAAVRDGARLLGLTDGAGRLEVDTAVWPSGPLRIEAPGHRASSWSPSDGLGEPGPIVIELMRGE